MKYDVYTIPPFDKQLKRLAKKFPSFKKDFSDFLLKLKKNPDQGIPLGNNCFKIRLAITSKKRGKSGDARIVTHLKVAQSKIYFDNSPARNADVLAKTVCKSSIRFLPFKIEIITFSSIV